MMREKLPSDMPEMRSARNRMFAVFDRYPKDEAGKLTGPPESHFFGPYRVVQFVRDELYVFEGLTPFCLAARTPDGHWYVHDGMGDESPYFESVRVVPGQEGQTRGEMEAAHRRA